MLTTVYSLLPPHVSDSMIQSHWSQLSQEEVEWTEGKTHRLLHAVVTRYGVSRAEAARQIVEFLQSLELSSRSSATSASS